MSTNRDADHTIRAWLDLMPDVAPDRAIDAVLQAVDETPQLRRPLVRGPRRFPRMNRLLLVAAVALIGAAMLGGTAALIGAGPPDANPPPSHPSTVPSQPPSPPARLRTPAAPRAAANPAPSRLRSTTWVADVEAITDLEFAGGPVTISIDDTGLHLASSTVGTAGSLESLIDLPTERYGFTLERAFADCPAGTRGYYRVYERDNTTSVEIVALSESCPARAELLARTWTRSTTPITP